MGMFTFTDGEVKVPEETPSQTQSPTKKKGPVDMDAIMREATPLMVWPEVVANLKQYSRVIASAFEGTTAYVSGDYLLIESSTDIPFKLLQNPAQRDNLRKAVLEITGKRYTLGPYKKPEEKKEEEVDPLDSLMGDLKTNGINVVEE